LITVEKALVIVDAILILVCHVTRSEKLSLWRSQHLSHDYLLQLKSAPEIHKIHVHLEQILLSDSAVVERPLA
jgi:hypothetical protein